MGRKKLTKVKVDKKHFEDVVKQLKSSIGKLGDGITYPEVEMTDRSIRRYLQAGEMPVNLLDRIAHALNIDPYYLSGRYFRELYRLFPDQDMRKHAKLRLKPECYPYIKHPGNVNYSNYFETILAYNGISMDQFNALSIEKRISLRQELDIAILSVISKFFSTDSVGISMKDILEHYTDEQDYYDMYYYYAKFEGIEMPEPDIDDDIDEDDDPFAEKYKKYREIPSNK